VLCFRPHRAQDLNVLPIEGLRFDQPANSQRHTAFHNDKEAVRATFTGLGQRAEEFPNVLLNLEGLKQGIVRSVEGQEFHGAILDSNAELTQMMVKMLVQHHAPARSGNASKNPTRRPGGG